MITIDGTSFGDDETVRIQNFNLNGLAGLADRGIHVASTADFGTLSVDNSSFTGFDFNAVIVNGPATGSLLDNVEISDCNVHEQRHRGRRRIGRLAVLPVQRRRDA